jgi:N4-gp56 family major capsid protein
MAGQNWTIATDGGHFANKPLSSKLRYVNTSQYVFRQFTRPEPGFGKQRGESIDFDKVSMAETQGGQIGEFQDIPETKFSITKDNLQVTEYGNSIPWTGKLETLSEFNPNQPVQKVIMNDQKKVLDEAVATEMKTSKLCYIATGAATQTWDVDGTASTTATTNFNYFHLKEMVDAAEMGIFGSGNTGKIIPKFPDGKYVVILSVKAKRGLFDDPEFQEAAKFSYPRKLLNGEIMEETVYNCRFVICDNSSALSNAKGTNSIGEALLIGDDSIIEGVALKEELRYKLAVKYGRDKGLAWYAILGFKKPWDYVTDGEEHIIRYTSA